MIIGGGIIGTCTAYFLRELGFTGRVLVLERDMTFRTASTTLSAASIRQQFGTPLNAEMSRFGFGFLRSLPDVGLVERGYLILQTPETAAAARATVTEEIVWFDRPALAARYPWLRTDDLAGATYGAAREGWFDAHLFLSAVRTMAKEAGVEFRQAEVLGIDSAAGRADTVHTDDGARIGCGTLICAAGPNSGALARQWGAALPVEPRKRTVFVIRAPLDGAAVPMLFDTTGFWLRPEGDGFICGIQPPPDRDAHPGADFEPDWWLWEDTLWPALAARIPALEQVRVVRAWAGHYEMNLLDHNGVVGPDPALSNLLYATGFSGHGVQHAPAVGRGVAELVMHGRYRALDLGLLGFGRVARGEPMLEAMVY